MQSGLPELQRKTAELKGVQVLQIVKIKSGGAPPESQPCRR
jgi:hypothetical protein